MRILRTKAFHLKSRCTYKGLALSRSETVTSPFTGKKKRYDTFYGEYGRVWIAFTIIRKVKT